MMFDLGAIIHSGAVRQHVIGTIRQDDLCLVAVNRIPETIREWRTEGHQVSLSANFSINWVVEACEWLNTRNIKFQLGARWMVEHHGTDIDWTLDNYVISVERDDFELIPLFQLIFV